MVEETRVSVRDDINPMALPDEDIFKREIAAINRFQNLVHATMIEGQDFGVIPGTDKPTLLKPGAEKISKLLGLADTYEILAQQEDWGKPFFRYLIRCNLTSVRNGCLISQGMGECNSMEAKYRWREGKRKCPKCGSEAIIKGKDFEGKGRPTGWLCFGKKGGCGAKFLDGDSSIEGQLVGRIENDDIYSVVNTILKMAKKRALVDAALSAGRLSNVFTQDIEDMPRETIAAKAAVKPEPATGAGPDDQESAQKPVDEFDQWLKEAIAAAQFKNFREAVAVIAGWFSVPAQASVSATVAQLSQEQREEFKKKLNERIDLQGK